MDTEILAVAQTQLKPSLPGTLPTDPPYRPGQAEAVHELLERIHQRTRFILLDGPVGSGKSKVLVDVARHLANEKTGDAGEEKGRDEPGRGLFAAYYSSPQVALVDQLRGDRYLSQTLRTIKGRSNYACGYFGGWADATACAYRRGMPCKCRSGKWTRPQACHWCREFTDLCPFCSGTKRILPGTCGACRGSGGLSRRRIRRLRWMCPVDREDRCGYLYDLRAATRAEIAVGTFDYLTRAISPEVSSSPSRGGGFNRRRLFILDEAHSLGERGVERLSQTLTGLPDALRMDDGFVDWETEFPGVWSDLDDEKLDALPPTAIGEALEALQPIVDRTLQRVTSSVSTQSEEREAAAQLCDRLERLSERIEWIVEDVEGGSDWVVDVAADGSEGNGKRLVAVPVSAAAFLGRHLWPVAESFVLASATFLDTRLFAAETGMNAAPSLLSVPPAFPPERSPIMDRVPRDGAGRMVSLAYSRRGSRDEEGRTPIDLVADELGAILEEYPSRGIVHCHTYANQHAIAERLGARFRERFVTHDPANRVSAFNAWLGDGRPDSAFLSVGFTEGIDLFDDRARWQAIAKCPYPFLGSRRVRRRRSQPDGRRWYDVLALRSLLQSTGRATRNARDSADTFLLDGAAVSLLERNGRLIPPEFQARLRLREDWRRHARWWKKAGSTPSPPVMPYDEEAVA